MNITKHFKRVFQLKKGDVFKHEDFDFWLTVSDAIEPEFEISTTQINQETGEHIFFIGEQLDDVVIVDQSKSKDKTL